MTKPTILLTFESGQLVSAVANGSIDLFVQRDDQLAPERVELSGTVTNEELARLVAPGKDCYGLDK